jgi:hypothetical protein
MITGGRLCGRVRYECSGDVQFSVLCHCRDCQKASGAGRVPVMGVLKSTFRVTGDARSYSMVGGSQKQATRWFCPNCGSLLFGTPEAVPDVVTIYVGGFDHPEVFKPQHAIFMRHRLDWDRLDADLPAYETVPEDGNRASSAG